MANKNFAPLLAALLVILALSALTNVQGANVTWGFARPFDRLLARDYIRYPPTWMTVTSADVIYPPKASNGQNPIHYF